MTSHPPITCNAQNTKPPRNAVSSMALALATLLLASCASSSSYDTPRACAQRAHVGQSCR